MDRRTFLLATAGGLLAAPLAAEAQPAGKVAKIGYLTGSSVGPLDAFRQALGEHGYIEGQTSRLRSDPLREELSGFPPLPPNWLTSMSMCSW